MLLAVAEMADKTQLPTKDRALKGREEKMAVAGKSHTSSLAKKNKSPATTGNMNSTPIFVIVHLICISGGFFSCPIRGGPEQN